MFLKLFGDMRVVSRERERESERDKEREREIASILLESFVSVFA